MIEPDAPVNKKRRRAVADTAGADVCDTADCKSAPPPPVLTVLRLMPSRAHVLCELGEEKVVCYVRRADLFCKGMTLEGARHRPDLGPLAWEYLGKLPRRRGMW